MSCPTLRVHRSEKSSLEHTSRLENIAFGSTYSDHLLVAHYEEGKWQTCEIKPYGNFSLPPSASALHYGQAIFEGMKAFKHKANDKVGIFRIADHFERMNHSATRLQMPKIEEGIFWEGMKQLLDIDRAWVPAFEGHSLYIRPFMFATDYYLGVRPSKSYCFAIICSPASAYYTKSISVIVQRSYSRAASGGIGAVKAAGNYAASLFPTQLAIQEGYDQVLWTDAETHQFVQEAGTMNLFFVVGEKVLTPSTEEGTILKGITRRSIIQLFRARGVDVEERKITVQELIDQHQKGQLKEIFGTGTAVAVNSVGKLKIEDNVLDLSNQPTTLASSLKKELHSIQYGETKDEYQWMTWI